MKQLVNFLFYSLFIFFLLLNLSACGSGSSNSPAISQEQACFSNSFSTDLNNDDFYIYNRISITGDEGLDVSVQVALGEFPISRGNPRNDIDLKNGESIELIIDGISYPLSASLPLGGGILPNICEPGILSYGTSVTLDQNIAYSAQLRIKRNSGNDIVSDFNIPYLLEVIEPSTRLDTYNPSTDSLFFSWINNLPNELSYELKDTLNCYQVNGEIPVGIQQYSILAGTNLDRLAASCPGETSVSISLEAIGPDLDVQTNLPDGQSLFTTDISMFLEIAEKLVY